MGDDELFSVMTDIRRRVAGAIKRTGLGPKPFAIKNRMGETVVRDLIKAHNKDVQLSTLGKIARGAGVPLASLLPGQIEPINPQALTDAIADAWPELPEDVAIQPEYLAQVVLDILRLPAGLQRVVGNDQPSEADEPGAKQSPA